MYQRRTPYKRKRPVSGRGKYTAGDLFREVGKLVGAPKQARAVTRTVNTGYKAARKAYKGPMGKAAMGMALASPTTRGAAMALQGVAGRGQYSVPFTSANDLIRGGASSVPQFTGVKDETGSLIVSHTERIADVIAPGVFVEGGEDVQKFSTQTWTVAPGLEKTFPWLSQIAACYEEYELIQCVFAYQGHQLSGLTEGLNVQGQVIAATKYNVNEPDFEDRHIMQSYPHASTCSFHGSLMHGVEAHPSKIAGGDTHRYVRTGGLTTKDDVRDYDHAKFSLGFSNTPAELANKEIGQLFLYYKVKFSKPKISAGRGRAISTFKMLCDSPITTKPFGDASAANQQLVCSKNSLDMKVETTVIPSVRTATATKNSFDTRVKVSFPTEANGVYMVRLELAATKKGDDTTLEGDELDIELCSGNVTALYNEQIGRYNRVDISDNEPNARFFSETVRERGSGTGGFTGLAKTFILKVRPQLGSVSNSFTLRFNGRFSFSNDSTSDATFDAADGDDEALYELKSSGMMIQEVNDFGSSSAIPEYVGILDGLPKIISMDNTVTIDPLPAYDIVDP
ncbi:hypothetical protein N8343_08325 [Akkermansiaceae bacterium]|nr:hypothetical protein [Akkermansiaceae bacterium]